MSQELGIKLEKSFFFDGYQLPANTRLPYRTVEMYELDCFSKSEGGIVLGEKNIRFEANTVNFRIPGQYVCGVMPYRGTGPVSYTHLDVYKRQADASGGHPFMSGTV